MNQSHRQKQGPQRGVKQELLRFSSEVLSCDRSVRRVANPYRAELRKECVQIASPHDVRPRLGNGACNGASNERHIFQTRPAVDAVGRVPSQAIEKRREQGRSAPTRHVRYVFGPSDNCGGISPSQIHRTTPVCWLLWRNGRKSGSDSNSCGTSQRKSRWQAHSVTPSRNSTLTLIFACPTTANS